MMGIDRGFAPDVAIERSTTAPVTVRLVNTDPHGRAHNLELPLMKPNVGRMKRGDVTTSLTVPAGGAVDLCKTLGIDLERARSLVQQEPIAGYVKARRLRVEDGAPPPMAYVPAVPAPQAPPPEPPPRNDPPQPERSLELAAILAARDQAIAGLPEEAQTERATAAPSEADAAALTARVLALGLDLEATVGALVRSAAGEAFPSQEDRILLARLERGDAPEAPPVHAPIDSEDVADAPAVPAAAAEQWPEGEPSTDWKETELRAYACAQGLDEKALRSKTAVLRAIRGKAQ